ncbi:TPA: hypothetical protein OVC47_002343 [Staphylococcus aureus]|uniref:hypothetical protein n=1 Tax=Staphylococcus epidermidis TaxID=1282 RepID=UPI001878FE54|nr:hypothetical protein [Staphylococcus epidermidis]MBE5677337.1 hypothetical protein [Staphylococcus singaporensis]HCU7654723.1 hypothetical protein [Staphylococcus aureus]MCG1566963.1 hypothetical protein [Staphylococcus epidermidis]HCW0036440.1 hypothetical protein [Staphylococcus aureus]HCW0039223.1 hypothetical protein [Staphylococcus aureus]
MKLIELLTTIEANHMNEMTFEGQDVLPLNEFIIEQGISYSTIDKADNDLELMRQNAMSEANDEEEAEEINEAYQDIIEEYKDIAQEEVYVQQIEVENGSINIRLS